MLFCPKCGSLLSPKEENGKKFMACSCGYSNKKAKGEFTESIADKEAVVIVDGDESPNPVVDAHCNDCGPVKAEFWMIQTRASDEPETQFFKCKKCGKTWKE